MDNDNDRDATELPSVLLAFGMLFGMIGAGMALGWAAVQLALFLLRSLFAVFS